MKKTLSLLLGLFLISSCTEQERARSFGETAETKIECNQKLVNLTWKETHLWILTKPMRDDDKAETYTFSESSSWGMMQGTVIIKESRCEIVLQQ